MLHPSLIALFETLRRAANRRNTKGAYGVSRARIAPTSDDPKYMGRAARQRLIAELSEAVERRAYAA